MKQSYLEAQKQSDKEFKRDTGISSSDFIYILSLVKNYIEEDFKRYPNKKKGLKPSLSIEDRLLLTLYYLRHYPTFKNLGDCFNISESYANKIYHYILSILVQVVHVKSKAELLNSDNLDTIVIDVSEQPIERPVKKQKQYYSGKKKPHY